MRDEVGMGSGWGVGDRRTWCVGVVTVCLARVVRGRARACRRGLASGAEGACATEARRLTARESEGTEPFCGVPCSSCLDSRAWAGRSGTASWRIRSDTSLRDRISN
jgi:hypothetical protein